MLHETRPGKTERISMVQGLTLNLGLGVIIFNHDKFLQAL